MLATINKSDNCCKGYTVIGFDPYYVMGRLGEERLS